MPDVLDEDLLERRIGDLEMRHARSGGERGRENRLRLDLGVGRAEAVVWTCDLSPEYVRINSDYTS